MPVGITVPDELIIIVFKYTCILTLFWVRKMLYIGKLISFILQEFFGFSRGFIY